MNKIMFEGSKWLIVFLLALLVNAVGTWVFYIKDVPTRAEVNEIVKEKIISDDSILSEKLDHINKQIDTVQDDLKEIGKTVNNVDKNQAAILERIKNLEKN